MIVRVYYCCFVCFRVISGYFRVAKTVNGKECVIGGEMWLKKQKSTFTALYCYYLWLQHYDS
jgi:hypothetical protein